MNDGEGRRLRRRDDVASEEVDGAVIAVDLRSASYFSAAGAGALLWRLLGSETDEVSLADALVDAYGIDRDRAVADTRAFVSSLQANGLLEG